ncbi:MAG: S8 family serine peptidase [Candidatus Zixiibacteriota bacterium]
MTSPKKLVIFFVTLIFPILMYNPAYCGQLAPELTAKISGTGALDRIPVVITLKQPAVKSNLKHDLISEYRTFKDRYQAGTARLKNETSIAQANLLAVMRQLERSGLADNVKGHWIVNAVTASLSVSELQNISSRADVDIIYELPELKLVEPDYMAPSEPNLLPSMPEPNIKMVGADSAWVLGYNGEGRIVCSFDTGVEGLHPALYDKWKGHDGDAAAAWFDPIGMQPFPHVFAYLSDATHGTHTMGIMVGACDTLQYDRDSIGVAPGAKWISAAVISLIGASVIDAFEWAADPDGDPNTISDVPDVINHSWEYKNLDCEPYFREMIDNTEALGIVNIFAAGNSGPDTLTISNPACLSYDSLDCFAVGSIYYGDSLIAKYSSRGPSYCNPLATRMIKPNLAAPGDSIWSSTGSQFITRANGTSMAAPHVSGAVAILRQYAPDATVDEIKQALIAGAVAPPDAEPLPNNTYGWGLLYIPAALTALDAIIHAPAPNLKIYSFDHSYASPGDTVYGTVIIKNIGARVENVVGTTSDGSGGLEILINSLIFGTVESGDTAHSDIEFMAVIDDTVTTGRLLSVNIDLSDGGSYQMSGKLYVRVGSVPEKSFYTHTNDILNFTISNFGIYGFAFNSFDPLSFSGFRYINMSRNDMFEGSFIIGTDVDHISDGIRNYAEEPDNDFAVAPNGDLVVSVPGSKADQQTSSIFDDSKAENPIGLEITQKTYSWNDTPNDNFIIMQYIVKNVSDSTVSGLHAGIFMDWDLHNERTDSSGYVLEENLGFISHGQAFTVPPKYRGVAVLNPEGMTTHGLITTLPNNKVISFTELEKFTMLAALTYTATPNTWYDPADLVSTGPFDLAPGALDTAVFAIVAADTTLANLVAAAAAARAMYDIVTDIIIVDNEILPDKFTLGQNYPNPFNPSTRIAFTLKSRSQVSLSIYNLLGRRVAELIDSELPAGSYETSWDGRDRFGNEAAAGVYFYRLEAGQSNLTRKMVLLK